MSLIEPLAKATKQGARDYNPHSALRDGGGAGRPRWLPGAVVPRPHRLIPSHGREPPKRLQIPECTAGRR